MLENDQVLFRQHRILSGKLPNLVEGLFLFLIVLVLFALAAANRIWLDIAVHANGMVRPEKEKTEVRAITAGLLDSIFVLEGQKINKGDTIAMFKDITGNVFAESLDAERKAKLEQLADLNLLLGQHFRDSARVTGLQSSLYQQEYAQFLQDWEARKIQGRLTGSEFSISEQLMKEKVIAKAEFAIKETAFRQQAAAEKAFWFARMASWSNDRQRICQELENLKQQSLRLVQSRTQLIMTSPAEGIVMGIREKYTSGVLQAGEILCTITPEDSLVAECLVRPADIGFLRKGQAVSFRIDAFDHQQFGTIKGKVVEIGHDYTSFDNHPVFRIRCSFESTRLGLRNGYSAILKKGMTLQARFIIARRSIWEICFDRLQNWLDPAISI